MEKITYIFGTFIGILLLVFDVYMLLSDVSTDGYTAGRSGMVVRNNLSGYGVMIVGAVVIVLAWVSQFSSKAKTNSNNIKYQEDTKITTRKRTPKITVNLKNKKK